MSAQQTLKKYFGFDSFRPGQVEIIEAIYSGQDTLAILPTGGGKSICFQIPGLMLEGVTLVISPLISLMKDQVDALRAKNIAATYINSSLNQSELITRLTKLQQEKYKFVYIAPERLFTVQFIKACQKIKISLLAIDEAHCISMWGHDFRPEYTQISQFINELSDQPTIAAFTATATQQVRQDIVASLKLSQPQIFLNSFKRDNLTFHATTCPDHFYQELALFIILNRHRNQAGIIYAATQRKTVYLARLIKHYWGDDFPVQAYHAGLESKQRAQIQDDFLANRLQIITATNAFGMGVDKANVRFVVHFQLAGNLENYYQEAGRAGRDQTKADCYLLFNPADLQIQQLFIDQSHPDLDDPLRLHQQQQLKKMVAYAQSKQCRLRFILKYFDEASEDCQKCDICRQQQLTLPPAAQRHHDLLTQTCHLLAQKNHLQPQQILSSKLLLFAALHQPQNTQDWLKLPGIGYGWVEKWYNLISQLLEKGTNYVDDPQTTHG